MSAPMAAVATPLSFTDRLSVWAWRYVRMPGFTLIDGANQ